MEFSGLVGKTLVSIEGLKEDSKAVSMRDSDGKSYCMWHQQDCCESVTVEDVCGDVADLIGSPIVRAEQNSTTVAPEGCSSSYEKPEWTFYRIATAKGLVVIRWYGESDYYSTDVDFEEVTA